MKKYFILIIYLLVTNNLYSQKFNDAKLRIAVNYGLNSPNNIQFDQSLNNSGSFGISLGTNFKIYERKDLYFFYFLSNFHYEYLSDANYPGGLNNNDKQYTATKFGLNVNLSLGYDFGNVTLIPFFSAPYSFSWSKYKKYEQDSGNYTPQTTEVLNKYENAFRYGRVREGGFIIGFGKTMDIKLSLERSMYYTRHLVFQEQLSTFIENISLVTLFTLNYFLMLGATDEYLGIFNFISQNALSFLFSQIKRNNQYWPFVSDKPLYFDTFRFELGFNINIPESKNRKIIL